jgi:hypothetical protein
VTPIVKIPVELRHRSEILDAFCFFWPASIAYLWRRLVDEVLSMIEQSRLLLWLLVK